jgi:hypothetical protein
MGELSPLVRDHPVPRLANADDAARLAAAPVEARIIAYADKRAGQQLEPMAARFASWGRRYPTGPAEPVLGTLDRPPSGQGWADETADLVVARAVALEREICGLAGVEPRDMRRLRWSRRALQQAALRQEASHGTAR